MGIADISQMTKALAIVAKHKDDPRKCLLALAALSGFEKIHLSTDAREAKVCLFAHQSGSPGYREWTLGEICDWVNGDEAPQDLNSR